MARYYRSPLSKYHNHHLALSIFLAILFAIFFFLPYAGLSFIMDNDYRILYIFIPLGAYLGFKAGRANRENMTLVVTIISLLIVFGIYGIGYYFNVFQLISLNDIIALIKDLSSSIFFVLIGVWVSWGLVA